MTISCSNNGNLMGGIREMIQVEGRECWTLFDTGARNSYVIPAVAEVLTTSQTPQPIEVLIGALAMQQ
jgi:hypothetical protein